MPDHIVKQGESLSIIAKKYKFQKWETIYQHADNEELREKRPNPNVLYPGDVVKIPEKEVKEAPAATGAKHKFVAKVSKMICRMKMVDEVGEPISDIPYVFQPACRVPIEGMTDANGLIEVPIPLQWGNLILFLQ